MPSFSAIRVSTSSLRYLYAAWISCMMAIRLDCSHPKLSMISDARVRSCFMGHTPFPCFLSNTGPADDRVRAGAAEQNALRAAPDFVDFSLHIIQLSTNACQNVYIFCAYRHFFHKFLGNTQRGYAFRLAVSKHFPFFPCVSPQKNRLPFSGGGWRSGWFTSGRAA